MKLEYCLEFIDNVMSTMLRWSPAQKAAMQSELKFEIIRTLNALLQCVVDRTFDRNQRSVLRSRRLWSERLADFPIDIVAAIARGHHVEAH